MRVILARFVAWVHPRGMTISALLGSLLSSVLLCSAFATEEWISGIVWPEVKVVDPGPVGGPPSDAIVLFDGTDLSQWDGGQHWQVKDGYAIATGREVGGIHY